MGEHNEGRKESYLSIDLMYGERVRLQSVISKFTLLAVKGRSCVHIEESSGKRVSAKYKLDKTLKKFSISHAGVLPWKYVCAVGAVQDVFIVQNSTSPFPTQVVSALES